MGRRLAILIGNQEFPGAPELPTLRGPKNDVEAMARILGDSALGGFEVSRNVNKGHDVVMPVIEKALHRLSRDDMLLLFYAGHGKLDWSGRLCLATPETQSAALFSTSIPIAYLRDMFEGGNCGTFVLLLDCCYSGAAGADCPHHGTGVAA